MEKTSEEMILVDVYADTTGQYTQEECDWDNICTIDIPRLIVYGYYKEHEAEFVAETMNELSIPRAECTFDNWYHSVYTCCDTDNLFQYAVVRGYHWNRPDEPEKWCGSADGYEVEVCPSCEHENEIKWDINKDGFEAHCPHCGAKMMLCDACHHKYGGCHDDDCDWCKGKGCHMDNAHRKAKKDREDSK